MSAAVEVLHPGALTTIQDLGRPGYAHLGIPRSGAVDRASLRLANRLVGNIEASPCLETTVVGPRLELLTPLTLALTGAVVDARLDQLPLAMNSPIHAPVGSVLTVGAARRGLHTYVALRGGIDCEPVFGSCSTDVRSGLGPPALSAGDRLTLGTASGAFPSVDVAPAAEPDEIPVLRVVLGPRADEFTNEAVKQLLSEEFRVTTEVSRIGAKLDGPRLQRASRTELLSEPVVSGAIQVPNNGKPILLLADHPTTGGYPVIAVVHSDDLGKAGQLRPGQRIRFRVPASARKPA
jgi:biotin-dependent carboxylase-like uncharacterized protein